jgi:molybdopterin molybdotransferase
VKADCDRADSPPIPEDEALSRLAEAARPVTDFQTEPLDRCLGRVLAQDRKADLDVPPADNSAMDGYACRHLDLRVPGTRLRVTQRVAAGDRPPRLEPGTAARIFTGACIPDGADTVVMQEDCRFGAEDGIDAVVIEASPRAGDHIRRRGEDIRAGETVLDAGTRLRPQDIGVAASIGLTELPVFRPLKVAIFFTGSELCEPGTELAPGMIYNSNRPMLAASLRALGCEVLDLGSIDDDRRRITATLERAAREADLVITSGGASVGEEDHIRAAIADAIGPVAYRDQTGKALGVRLHRGHPCARSARQSRIVLRDIFALRALLHPALPGPQGYRAPLLPRPGRLRQGATLESSRIPACPSAE